MLTALKVASILLAMTSENKFWRVKNTNLVAKCECSKMKSLLLQLVSRDYIGSGVFCTTFH